MNKEINILYIDDKISTELTKYIYSYCKESESCSYGGHIKFESTMTYESLISSSEVKKANIIIIDSSLFENRLIKKYKFTGEDFKIIFKKISPYTEVIVISQDTQQCDYGIFEKYKSYQNKELTEYQYYENKLGPLLEEKIRSIIAIRNIFLKMKMGNNLNKVLVDKIGNLLDGISEYEELTSDDINKVIKLFQEIESKING